MSCRILWVGDSPLVPTGFGQVTRNVCGHWHEAGYEVSVFGVHYDGSEPIDNPYPIYPASQGRDLCGFSRIAECVSLVKPDILWLFGDIWVVNNWRRLTKEYGVKTIAYIPVDAVGYMVHPEWGENLGDCFVCTTTEFGRRELEAAGVADVGVLPHGADDTIFKPDYPDRRGFNLDEDAFIVLNANRNQPRKRFDLTLQSFCLFVSCLPETANVKLWLHTGTRDHGWDLMRCFDFWANYYSLSRERKYLYLTHDKPYQPNVSLETLAKIYRCADVVLNTSLGEGWGLVAHESALCGVAQVVPNNSASAEIWSGYAPLIECKSFYQDAGTGLVYLVPSVASVVEYLSVLYWHQDYRDKVAHLCYSRALEYSWRRVLPLFDKVLETVA